MMSRGRQPERFLATILFTDIVGSTDLAAQLGDAEWRRLIAAHHAAVRKQLRAFGGREVDTAGDGFLCSFEQPAQAVRAADAIVRDVALLGLRLRAGIHTGECELIGNKIGGIAVHIAARVMATAAPGQVLVSSTVRDLVAGSQLEFEDAGTHELKGVPGEWHLYRGVVRAPQAAAAGAETAMTGSLGTPGATRTAGATAGQTSLRRRWPLVAIAIGVTIVLAAAALAYATGVLGPSKPPPVAAPNSIVTLDAATGDVVGARGVPIGPVALAHDSATNRLWVASLDAGVVTDYSLGSDAAERSTGRVGRPTDLAVGGGSVWVADAYGESVTLVDAATGQPQKTVPNVHARQIAFGFDSAWSTDDIGDRLLRLDRQSGEIAQVIELELGGYPSGLAIGAHSVWLGNVGSSTISEIDPSTGSVVSTGIALRQPPDAMAADGGDVWIASRDADMVIRLNTAGSTNSVSQTFPVGDQPVAIALGGDTLWIACAGPREVWHVDPDGTVISKTPVVGVPTDIVVVGDRVYVSVRE